MWFDVIIGAFFTFLVGLGEYASMKNERSETCNDNDCLNAIPVTVASETTIVETDTVTSTIFDVTTTQINETITIAVEETVRSTRFPLKSRIVVNKSRDVQIAVPTVMSTITSPITPTVSLGVPTTATSMVGTTEAESAPVRNVTSTTTVYTEVDLFTVTSTNTFTTILTTTFTQTVAPSPCTTFGLHVESGPYAGQRIKVQTHGELLQIGVRDLPQAIFVLENSGSVKYVHDFGAYLAGRPLSWLPILILYDVDTNTTGTSLLKCAVTDPLGDNPLRNLGYLVCTIDGRPLDFMVCPVSFPNVVYGSGSVYAHDCGPIELVVEPTCPGSKLPETIAW